MSVRYSLAVAHRSSPYGCQGKSFFVPDLWEFAGSMVIVWFLLGFVGLLLLIGLFQLFRSVDTSKLATGLRWTGSAVLVCLSVPFVLSGNILPVLCLALLAVWLVGLLPLKLLARLAVLVGGRAGGDDAQPVASPISIVETSHLQMQVDRDHGPLSGSVVDGRFGGRTLGEMNPDELLLLLADLRTADLAGARLLEAWGERALGPGWRQRAADRADAARASSRQVSAHESPMTHEDAFAVLGLKSGAQDHEVREAHRRLMRQAHPDAGGSDVRAARLNVAKDLLLK